MLQRSLITATCMLAFTALTASTAAALVVTAIGGGTNDNNVSCTYQCTSPAGGCTGTWQQTGFTAGPPPSATESCPGANGNISCSVTANKGATATNVAACFLSAVPKAACTGVLCGKQNQYCVYLSPNGNAYCVGPTAPPGGAGQ
jgi:hypothetical protein